MSDTFRAGDRVQMRDRRTGAHYSGVVARSLNNGWYRVLWDVTSTISSERGSILEHEGDNGKATLL